VDIAAKITYNSNNQNAIRARDLRSNSTIQIRLQKEVGEYSSGEYALTIKGGERLGARVLIDNEVAGKLLLAFDLEEPWSSHQAYKIFDESYDGIFGRPLVNGRRIILLHLIMVEIEKGLDSIENQLFAHYSMTRYFLLYLLSLVLQKDPQGAEIYRDVDMVMREPKKLASLLAASSRVLGDLIVDLNGEAMEAGENFDYKNLLKSQERSKVLAEKVVGTYRKLVQRGRIKALGEEYLEGLTAE
jgi:hypothetical protein